MRYDYETSSNQKNLRRKSYLTLFYTQISTNYTCYYEYDRVTSILWSLQSPRDTLIQLCVGFGLSGGLFIVLIITLLCWIVDKIKYTCCSSIFSLCSKKNF